MLEKSHPLSMCKLHIVALLLDHKDDVTWPTIGKLLSHNPLNNDAKMISRHSSIPLAKDEKKTR